MNLTLQHSCCLCLGYNNTMFVSYMLNKYTQSKIISFHVIGLETSVEALHLCSTLSHHSLRTRDTYWHRHFSLFIFLEIEKVFSLYVLISFWCLWKCYSCKFLFTIKFYMFINTCSRFLSQSKSKSESKVWVQSPIPKSNIKVQFKSPIPKSKSRVQV